MDTKKAKIKITVKPKNFTDDHVNTLDIHQKKSHICQHSLCQEWATFGYPQKHPQYCQIHKTIDMVSLKNKVCVVPDCGVTPSYGFEGSCLRLYCYSHKNSDMIDVVHKKCRKDGCEITPSYAYVGTRTPVFCTKHKEDGMINVKDKLCQYDKCETRAYYGYCGSNDAQFCNKHKKTEMIDLRHKMCLRSGCTKRPSFGYDGTTMALYCDDHKEVGMTNVNNKKCQAPKCKRKPHFGYVGTKSAIFCSEHKHPNMIDLVHSKCQHEKCTNSPSYGHIDAKIPTHCSDHREIGMIELKHRHCAVDGCTVYASYGISGYQPSHCTTHRKAGETLNPTKRCQIMGCHNLALFGYTTPTHCEEHKTSEEIDLVQRNCTQCGLPDVLDVNGHCQTCDPTVYNRVRLAKQKKVRDFFDYHHMNYISYDRIIDRGICGKERPDFIFDCGSHMIVVEVDESQHDGYSCECEQVRMINIGQSLGIPVLFIRYNPDKYKPLVGRANNKDFQRMDSLKKQVEYWQKTPLPTDGCCFVTHLYYDGDDPSQWRNVIKLL